MALDERVQVRLGFPKPHLEALNVSPEPKRRRNNDRPLQRADPITSP
jgi:hypothetical protein